MSLPLLLFSCALPLQDEVQPLFTDVSSTALAGVSTTSGSPAKNWILEVNGGGIVLGDFDGDGDTDLVVVDGSSLEAYEQEQAGLPPRLFLNDGKGVFAPAGEAWALQGGRWGMGGSAGDVNGDGWLDLFVSNWGADRLYLNDGGKGFVDATEDSGLRGKRWGTSAAFLDYDADGALDLVVLGYLAFRPGEISPAGSPGCQWKGLPVMCGPEGLVPVHDQLYKGKGDGTFEDVSQSAGFRPDKAGFALGVMTLDYDSDGDTDIYVANDSTPNHLWENQGDGNFVEVGFRRGVAYDPNGREQAGMGIACGDLGADGRPDLFVTNFSGETNALYRGTKLGNFREKSSMARLSGASLHRLGWGTGMGDVDLDGDLDLFVLNGHVYPQADSPGTDTSYAQPDLLFLNTDERFAAESLYAGADVCSRAGAFADLDGDGDLDLVALSVEGPVRILRNDQSGEDRHWLRVQLRGRGGNTFGIGARIRAEWEGGSRTAELRTSAGYQASTAPEAHFGLGAHAQLKRLVVLWPSGKEQVLEDVAVDRVLVVEEAE
jgi:enediyne biosynthesis protein E4